MDNIINYQDTTLTWEFKKKKAFLKSEDKTILELKTRKNRATFERDDKEYSIRNRGFWNPSTVIENGKDRIVTLNRFFRGSTASIAFSNGAKYFMRCKNSVLIKLSIYSDDHKEIARYKLISKYKASMNLFINNNEVPAQDMTFLLVLGCFIFRSMIRENKTTTVESIIFSNPVPVKEEMVAEPA